MYMFPVIATLQQIRKNETHKVKLGHLCIWFSLWKLAGNLLSMHEPCLAMSILLCRWTFLNFHLMIKIWANLTGGCYLLILSPLVHFMPNYVKQQNLTAEIWAILSLVKSNLKFPSYIQAHTGIFPFYPLFSLSRADAQPKIHWPHSTLITNLSLAPKCNHQIRGSLL